MSIFQIVVLVGIALLSLKEFWGPVSTWLTNYAAEAKVAAQVKRDAYVASVPTPTAQVPLNEVDVNVQKPELSLSVIVGKWEELRTMCREYNLNEAEEQLDKVFPLLLDDKE